MTAGSDLSPARRRMKNRRRSRWANASASLASRSEFLSASILTLDEELLVHDRRVGFVAGTAPDEKQKALKVGECIRILGIPRVDLALVSWRIDNAPKKPDVLKWGLPYEIVAVGVFEDKPHECGDE